MDTTVGKQNGAWDKDKIFWVNDWQVDPANNQIQLGDVIAKLEPKVMDVLIYFAQRPGQVISREELEDNVWSGRIVSYDALSSVIVKLRKAFQQDNTEETVIKTVPKRGYSLVAPIRFELPASDNSTKAASTATVATSVEPIVSNPDDTSPTATQQPLKKGLLVVVSIFVVLSILLVFWYSSTAPQETSNTQRKASGAPYGGTTDIEAQNAFDEGWQKFREDTPESYKTAIALLRRATVLDPDYGQAHAALAALYLNTWERSWHIMLDTAPLPRTWELASRSLQSAMKRPTPLAYQVSTEILILNRRFDEAIREANKAIELAPNNPISHATLAKALVFAGKLEESRSSIDKAIRLNPRYPVEFLFIRALIDFNSGQYAKASTSLEQAIARSPQNHIYYIHLIAAYGYLGNTAKATRILAEANRLRKACQLPLITSTPADHFYNNLWQFQNVEDINRLHKGLEAAGVPKW